MEIRWRVSASCKAEEREVVLTEARATADFIADCFVDRGCTDVEIVELPARRIEGV